MPPAKQLDEVIALLASLYPNTFAVFEQRRRPLKLKIHVDLSRRSARTLDRTELSAAGCSMLRTSPPTMRRRSRRSRQAASAFFTLR